MPTYRFEFFDRRINITCEDGWLVLCSMGRNKDKTRKWVQTGSWVLPLLKYTFLFEVCFFYGTLASVTSGWAVP